MKVATLKKIINKKINLCNTKIYYATVTVNSDGMIPIEMVSKNVSERYDVYVSSKNKVITHLPKQVTPTIVKKHLYLVPELIQRKKIAEI